MQGLKTMFGRGAGANEPFDLNIHLLELSLNPNFLPEELVRPGNVFSPYLSAIVNDQATERRSMRESIRGANVLGGAVPINETLAGLRCDENDRITLELWDKNVGPDSLVATAALPIPALLMSARNYLGASGTGGVIGQQQAAYGAQQPGLAQGYGGGVQQGGMGYNQTGTMTGVGAGGVGGGAGSGLEAQQAATAALIFSAPIAFNMLPADRIAEKFNRMTKTSGQGTTSSGVPAGGMGATGMGMGGMQQPVQPGATGLGGVAPGAAGAAVPGQTLGVTSGVGLAGVGTTAGLPGVARVVAIVRLYNRRMGQQQGGAYGVQQFQALSLVEQAGLSSHLGPAGMHAAPAMAAYGVQSGVSAGPLGVGGPGQQLGGLSGVAQQQQGFQQAGYYGGQQQPMAGIGGQQPAVYGAQQPGLTQQKIVTTSTTSATGVPGTQPLQPGASGANIPPRY